MDGLILVHKPPKLTSHDVVDNIRQILSTKKAGHFGTLDPFATGLLVIAVGKATRLFPFYLKTDKSYKARIKLGVATDTYDLDGKPVSEENSNFPDTLGVQKTMEFFVGNQLQVPPIYSAKKFKGKPLYVYARENNNVEPKPCPITIYEFDLKKYHPPFLDCFIRCSSGTYIRSIAHDLGQKLGCGAHLTQLQRTAVGLFRIEDSLNLENIADLTLSKKYNKFLIPLESLLPEYPKIVLTEFGAKLARNGNKIIPENILNIYGLSPSKEKKEQDHELLFRLFSPDGELLALAKTQHNKSGLHPFLVIDTGID
ncbi:MAG: tRNA pseudouridine(55) synthase TruB [Candidatus Aminicenantes bacterium]|nr:tRNA pseudouridine(55) synthase TruB [Candidatus Aminicenantes bacterium]